MGLLDSAGMQRLWAKIKAHVQPYIKDASLEGNVLTFTKGTGESTDITLPSSSTNRVTLNTTGSGNAVTSITQAGNALTITKGETFATNEDVEAIENRVADLESNSSSGGNTSSGDSSIIDLGAQENHKDAQQAIVDQLLEVETGCYLFKYRCSCYGNSCFAIVNVYYDFVIECRDIAGTVYDNIHSFREFRYTSDDGFILDGCWEEIGSSSGTGLSMPRIRLANHWQGEDGVSCNKEYKEWVGSYIFSVEIMDGTVQEGDQLQICSLTNHKNSRGVRVRKPRRFSERVITAEDIEMLQYNPYLQILVEGSGLRELYRSCSSDGTLYRYPKYIRLRRPKYDEEGQETGATFSNVVCADVRLPVTFFYE